MQSFIYHMKQLNLCYLYATSYQMKQLMPYSKKKCMPPDIPTHDTKTRMKCSYEVSHTYIICCSCPQFRIIYSRSTRQKLRQQLLLAFRHPHLQTRRSSMSHTRLQRRASYRSPTSPCIGHLELHPSMSRPR